MTSDARLDNMDGPGLEVMGRSRLERCVGATLEPKPEIEDGTLAALRTKSTDESSAEENGQVMGRSRLKGTVEAASAQEPEIEDKTCDCSGKFTRFTEFRLPMVF